MSDIGPELPPHLLAKRKRKQEQEQQDADTTTSGAKRSPSPGEGEKRRRIIGPAMPPAPLDERPMEPKSARKEDSSDDDDDFGPAPPPTGSSAAVVRDEDEATQATNAVEKESEPTKRDEWMMMPPKQDDLAARMDPSKQRARGFNTGKGAKAPQAAGGDNSAWHETPEQKRKRLEDEMMGISQPVQAGSKPTKPASKARDEEAAARIREHTEKTRGPSLLEQHEGSGKAVEDDDPSKRAFDREKDMGSGMRINQTQRKEMLSKAGGFSSKFSGGSYL